jgi:hypothetical protein
MPANPLNEPDSPVPCRPEASAQATMVRSTLKTLLGLCLLLLLVSCHPAGCYGPKAFGYNTKGVAAANLVGAYTFDAKNAATLGRLGFTNHSGSITLRQDMTFVCSNLPCVEAIPKPGGYSSWTGKWRLTQEGLVWNVGLYDEDFGGAPGLHGLTLAVLGDHPPHGLQLYINEDAGYWVRLRRAGEGR